jgi:long-chain acyl-CoA synthetase
MEVHKLFDFIRYQKEKYPQEVSLAEKVDGKWVTYSTDDVIEKSNQVSKGLIAMGVQPGDKIAIISNNRPQWNFVDIGLLQVGAIDVPIYPTISASEYEYIFNHAEIKMAFVSSDDLLKKVLAIKDSVPTLGEIFSFEEIKGCRHWSEVLEAGKDVEMSEVESRMEAVKPGELATMIYTSGTTGKPKGVMLSHDNIVSNVKSTGEMLPLNETHRTLSFLPLCHIFERMVLYTYMSLGASVYYAESMEAIGDNLKEVKPHFFSTVPRLLEKVYEKIVGKGNALTGVKKKLFFWALELGGKYKVDQDQGMIYNLQLSIARKLIFSKWQEALGGELIGIVTGAAALPEMLCKVFNAAGIQVREGFGQTESSPVISFNRFEKGGCLEGTVGIPIPGVEVKIAENGEIVARGPNIMLGYYKDPDKTAETVDAEGWLHTGDIGKIIDGKFIKITDRLKELFKTSGGKYVAPQPIENKYKESFLVEQIMVVGENKKFVGALIVPSFANLGSWCKDNNIPFDPVHPGPTLNHPKVQEKFREICDTYNKDFSKIEQIKKFSLIPNEWTVDGGEMTPTMKVKRRVVVEKYGDFINEIYS